MRPPFPPSISPAPPPPVLYYYKMQMLCHPLHAEINLLFRTELQEPRCRSSSTSQTLLIYTPASPPALYFITISCPWLEKINWIWDDSACEIGNEPCGIMASLEARLVLMEFWFGNEAVMYSEVSFSFFFLIFPIRQSWLFHQIFWGFFGGFFWDGPLTWGANLSVWVFVNLLKTFLLK